MLPLCYPFYSIPTTIMDEISQKEIHYLYELINRGVLRPATKSIVTFELTKLLDRLNLPSIDSPSPETPQPKIALFVTSIFHDSKTASESEKISMSLTVSPNASLAQLVRDIEIAQTYRPNSKILRLQHIRSGREYTDYDNSTVKSCDFRDGDRIVVQCNHQETTVQTIESLESVDPMIATIDSVRPSSNNDILVAACHYFMLSQGFLYLTEQPSTVAGFAPSLKGFIHNLLLYKTYCIIQKRAYSLPYIRGAERHFPHPRLEQWAGPYYIVQT